MRELYTNAVEWIKNNLQDKRLSDKMKEDFLNFETLTPENKAQLFLELHKLSESGTLPEEIKASFPWLTFDLNELPGELVLVIGDCLRKYKHNNEINNLGNTSGAMYSLFNMSRPLLDKFLRHAADGKQNKVDELFTTVYKGNDARRQGVLCYQREFTDYLGRTFNCTAYEYAYWTMNIHMCHTLEKYMDDETKTTMLVRIEAIDENGLTYHLNGEEIQEKKYSDLTKFINALQVYVNGYNDWYSNDNWAAMKEAWSKTTSMVPLPFMNGYFRQKLASYLQQDFNEYDSPAEVLDYTYTLYQGSSKHLLDYDEGMGPAFWKGGSSPGLQEALRSGWTNAVTCDLAVARKFYEIRTKELRQSHDFLKDVGAGASSSLGL